MSRFTKRAWGWYIVLFNAKRFKIKLLRFYKGRACSRQLHKHRNELWLMIGGLGRLNSRILRSGDWHAVHKKRVHRFTAYKASWILEVQYGDKCEEKDIVRL